VWLTMKEWQRRWKMSLEVGSWSARADELLQGLEGLLDLLKWKKHDRR
jgi:hypothetical protein